jgi:hypothetical protein
VSGNGWIAYVPCLASEVPASAVWHAEERRWFSPGVLRTEYSWGDPSSHPDWVWEGFAGMPWMRKINTSLPESTPGRITYFRDQDIEPSGQPENHDQET